jgi:hypothetical protein
MHPDDQGAEPSARSPTSPRATSTKTAIGATAGISTSMARGGSRGSATPWVASPPTTCWRRSARVWGNTSSSKPKKNEASKPFPDHRKDGRALPGEAERTDQRHPSQPRQEQAIRADGAPHPQVHEIRRGENYETWLKEAAHQEVRKPQGKPPSTQKSAPLPAMDPRERPRLEHNDFQTSTGFYVCLLLKRCASIDPKPLRSIAAHGICHYVV